MESEPLYFSNIAHSSVDESGNKIPVESVNAAPSTQGTTELTMQDLAQLTESVPLVHDGAQGDGASSHGDADDVLTEEEYMKRFEEVANGQTALSVIIEKFGNREDDQQRLYITMEYVRALHVQNERMYDLLVEMNNFLGAK